MSGRGIRWEGRGRSSLLRAVFGDRIGLALFLGSVALFAVFWVVEWRINDSLTLYNTLHGMSMGRLDMPAAKYGSTLRMPGSHVVDGRIYGRNYGMLTLSLVPLAVLRGLAAVSDLRIALTGLWVLALVALALVVGSVLDRQRVAARVGSVAGLVVFLASVAVATPLDPTRSELYALQITHLLIGAFVVVATYRLLLAVEGRRPAVLGAFLVATGTPLGLWSTIPKRHVVTAAVVMVVGYALYRSRTADRQSSATAFRGLAYAAVGFLAWVHAPEAFLLFLLLVCVDVPTATNDARSLVLVGAAFALSLVPFLVTNYLLSGSPVRPPRSLSTAVPTVDTGGASGGSAASGGDGGSSGGIPNAVLTLLFPVLTILDLFEASVSSVLEDPGGLGTVFLRSGYVESIAAESHQESVNLSVLESTPLLGAVAGAVPVVRSALARGRPSLRGLSPERLVDLYMAGFALSFSLLYLSRLPLHAQITARYLLPVVPALTYLVVRLPAVRRVGRERLRTVGWTYAGAVLVGGQLVVVALVTFDPGVGEAFQFHALLGLSVAVPLALWALLARPDRRWDRAGAVCLGLAAASVTVFLLLVTLDYFAVDNGQALPLVRAVGELVSIT